LYKIMNNILCITGMHRSSTSLCASWLEGCGLKLFEQVEGNVGNTLGHFEDKEILAIHSRALRQIDKRTKGWIVNKGINPNFSASDRIALANLLAKRNSYDLWGWKDPRNTLFLNEWKKMIPNLKCLLLW